MAIRTILTVIAQNHDALATASFHAGSVLARSATGGTAGKVRPADRATDTVTEYVGIAADDTARQGNTMIIADSVGSTYLDPSTGEFIANNNALYAAPKRAIGDFQSEHVNGVTNLTAGATGFEGPRRGVGVYTSQGAQFVVDQFAAVATTGATTDDTTPLTFAINDVLTFGVGANAGLFVKRASSTHGPAVAKVDKYDATSKLLYITQLL